MRHLKDQIKQLSSGAILNLKKIIVRKLLSGYKKGPAFYSNVDWRKFNSRKYLLTNPNNFHLGDGINFALLLSNDQSYILEAYPTLDRLLKSLIISDSFTRLIDERSLLVIKPIGSLIDLYYILTGRPILIIDLMDVHIPEKIPNYLMKIIAHRDIKMSDFKDLNRYKYQITNCSIERNFIVVNLELASGIFRVKNEFYKIIWLQAINFARENNLKVVLVGVKKTKYPWMYIDNKINVKDLRGQLTIDMLIQLLASNFCVGIFSFDNLIMHIGNIFEIKNFIKFRGKSTALVEKFHYKIVNISYREEDNINYI